jgi:hypothetical protein
MIINENDINKKCHTSCTLIFLQQPKKFKSWNFLQRGRYVQLCIIVSIPRHDLTMFDSVVLRSEFCATTDHFKGAHN